jgi:hypothetical protein
LAWPSAIAVLVCSHRLGIAAQASCTAQYPRGIPAQDAGLHDDFDSLPAEIVDDSQTLQTPPVRERVDHKIRRPFWQKAMRMSWPPRH